MFKPSHSQKPAFLRAATGLAGLLALSFQAYAYHPLATDDTGTQGAGGNQLEFGFDYAHSETSGLTEIERAVPFTYTRGLTDALDVFVGLPYLSVSGTGAPSEKGWGGPAVGLKWRFYEDAASKLSLALKPEIEFEPVDDDLGSGDPTYALSFILSQETGFGEFHANLEVAYNGDEDRETQYRFSVAPVWQVNEQWKLALDLGLQTNPDIGEDAAMGFVELGAVYSPSEDLDFSLGIVRDVMDGPASTTSATLGLTWRFR